MFIFILFHLEFCVSVLCYFVAHEIYPRSIQPGKNHHHHIIWASDVNGFSLSLLFHFIFLIFFNALLFRFDMRCVYFAIRNCLANSHTHTHAWVCERARARLSLILSFLQFDLNVGCLTVLLSWRLFRISSASRWIAPNIHLPRDLAYTVYEANVHMDRTMRSNSALEIFGILVCISIVKIGFCRVIAPIVVAWATTICSCRFAFFMPTSFTAYI